MSTFIYRPLTPNKRTTRLIHLQPRSTHNPSKGAGYPANAGELVPEVRVLCTISHVSLDRPPPYSALSYTWGDGSQTGFITVGESNFRVRKSLEVALFHLTPDVEPLSLWIDALCINQNNEGEKTEQVQQMQHIYSMATSVITWLGPAAENSDAAMQWIKRYGSLSLKFGIGMKPELRLNHPLKTFESDPMNFSDERL